MKKVLLALSCTLITSTAVYADNCEAVKAQIAEKIKANGVPAFTLDAVEKGTVTDKKIVGVCGGGTKDIVYQRGAGNQSTSTEQTKAANADSNATAPETSTSSN